MTSMIRLRLLAGAVASFVALAHAGAALAQGTDSGFLRDYSRLDQAKDSGGRTIRAWASPKFTPDTYSAVLLDPLVFYPEPRPTERVSAEELQRILKYANDAVRLSLSKRVKLVDRAGPGVVRVRAAITSVAAKAEGLKPYQLVPLAFIATQASRAAQGGAPQQAAIVIEAEAVDSTTGELLASRVKVGTGERLAKSGGNDVITLEAVKPLLDELAENAYTELPKYVKGK